jgi:diguanylate cyclase (GGDEF)-like protein
LADLSKLAESDPAMALLVVKLVNSPAFKLAHPVTNVQRATALLGLRGVRNVALSLVLSDMVPMGPEGRVLLSNALRRAMACRAVADRLGARDRDAYFTTGLFLEAGHFTLASHDLEKVAAIARAPAAHRRVRERACGWEPHPSFGARLAEHHGLGAATVAAIAQHHADQPPEEALGRAAWLAERLAAVFEGGDHEKLVADANSAAMTVGLSPEVVGEILSDLPEMTRVGASSLDRRIDEQRELADLVDDAHRGLVDLNVQYEQLVRTLETVISEKEALAEELRQANATLAALATTDPLTGLPNKRGLDDFLTRTLSRASREDTHVTLMMIDIDHFKKFNDTWGHATGDEVLRVVGRVFMQCVRAGDMAARYGGEEFTIVLPTADEAGALVVAERVRKAVAEATVQGPRGPLHVTVSIGLTTARGSLCRKEELFALADRALYDSKKAGRNRVTAARLT